MEQLKYLEFLENQVILHDKWTPEEKEMVEMELLRLGFDYSPETATFQHERGSRTVIQERIYLDYSRSDEHKEKPEIIKVLVLYAQKHSGATFSVLDPRAKEGTLLSKLPGIKKAHERNPYNIKKLREKEIEVIKTEYLITKNTDKFDLIVSDLTKFVGAEKYIEKLREECVVGVVAHDKNLVAKGQATYLYDDYNVTLFF